MLGVWHLHHIGILLKNTAGILVRVVLQELYDVEFEWHVVEGLAVKRADKRRPYSKDFFPDDMHRWAKPWTCGFFPDDMHV